MELVAIRHLPTDYNRKGILQGRRDIPILPPDPDQSRLIRENRERLGDFAGFDAILASTLKRTSMTAECYGAPYQKDPLLDELDFGPWEGRKKADLVTEVPLWTEKPDQLTLGEPVLNLEIRIRRLLENYAAAGKILVFGHGAWIRALVSLNEHGSIRNMNRILIPNNELVRLNPAREA